MNTRLSVIIMTATLFQQNPSHTDQAHASTKGSRNSLTHSQLPDTKPITKLWIMKLVVSWRRPSLRKISLTILFPLHIHRRNAIELSIQTFKEHFIAGIFSTDPKYPAQEWYYLLPQANMTLNLLQTSRTSPKISSYIAIFGMHDFNRRPLAPPSTKLIVHEKT